MTLCGFIARSLPSVREKWIRRISQQSFRLITLAAEVRISSAVPELREAFLKVALIGLAFLFVGAAVKIFAVLFIGSLTFFTFGIASFSLEIVSRPKSVIKSYFVILAFSTAAILTYLLGGLDREINLIPASLPHSAALFGIMTSPATNTEIFQATVVLGLILAVGMFLSLVMLAVVGGVMIAALVIVSRISAFLLAKVTRNVRIYCIAGLLAIGAVFAAIYPILDLLTQP